MGSTLKWSRSTDEEWYVKAIQEKKISADADTILFFDRKFFTYIPRRFHLTDLLSLSTISTAENHFHGQW